MTNVDDRRGVTLLLESRALVGAGGELAKGIGVFNLVAGNQFLPGGTQQEMHLFMVLSFDGCQHGIERQFIAGEERLTWGRAGDPSRR